MDELIISLIIRHLDAKDIVLFAQVDRRTYSYCKNTNVNNKLCKCAHATYHHIPTLLEHAKLECCLSVLNDVETLSNHKIPMEKFSLELTLQKPCGTKIHVMLGRCIIINPIVYSYSHIDFLAESQYDIIKDGYAALSIHDNIDRLRHKINSIISHEYTHVNMTIHNKLQSDFKRSLVNGLTHIHRFVNFCTISK
jgi:hypothetical protein